MIDEAGSRITAEADKVVRPQLPVTIIQRTTTKCARCGKPTKSHRLKHCYLCHGCYTKMTEEELDQWRKFHDDGDSASEAREQKA